MRNELEDLLTKIKTYAREHDTVKDNPQKLLDANGKGAKECTRVSDECARSMDTYMRAEGEMVKSSFQFLGVVRKSDFQALYDLNNDHRADMELALTAVRFSVVAIEFSLSPSAHRSHGRKGPEIDRYFQTREELFQGAKRR